MFIAALAAGTLLPVQAGLNSAVGIKLGGRPRGILISFAGGTTALTLAVLISYPFTASVDALDFRDSTWWTWYVFAQAIHR